jgi:hypothetical protein
MKWLLGGFAATVMALLAKKERETVDDPVAGTVPVVPTGPDLRPGRTEVDRPGKHWTWAELSVSDAARQLGLDNTPTPEARANLRWMCAHVLDPLRERYGSQVRVTSAYRSPAVNKAVGGVANSRHVEGLAVDLVLPQKYRLTTAQNLRARGLKVLEYAGHLHIAWAVDRPR